MKPPLVSIIIPTLNASKVLSACLESISVQNYPQSKTEIIVADGGSTDETLAIAKKHRCVVVQNKLKTSESGKVAGINIANGKYIALIDSDNILPDSKWLTQMIAPLEVDKDIIGSEPWEFTYRPHSGFIERYSALLGANDPYAYVLGIYDRRNYITNRWSAIKMEEENLPGYLRIKLKPNSPIPTIGANGTIFRTEFIKKHLYTDYLFDIDILTLALREKSRPLYFAKVKNGIIHTYCESSIFKFYRKQLRRLKDYFHYKKFRNFNYNNNLNQNPVHDLSVLVKNNIKFAFYTLLVVPMLVTTFKGYLKKPDPAWFFHPLACLITFYIYFTVSITAILGISQVQSRNQWQQ